VKERVSRAKLHDTAHEPEAASALEQSLVRARQGNAQSRLQSGHLLPSRRGQHLLQIAINRALSEAREQVGNRVNHELKP